MKIISGKHRSRKIKTLDGLHTRPPLELVRAAYFNSIGKGIENIYFLDCFAGSGSMGIEALSRGAKHCIFIESFRKSSKLIEENLKSLNEENFEILSQKLSQTIDYLNRKEHRFSYIFADPPFDQMMKGFHLDLPELLAPLLTTDGLLSIRYPENAPFMPLTGPLEEGKSRKYGLSLIRQFNFPETESESKVETL